jgi:CRISPR-associated protein Cst1
LSRSEDEANMHRLEIAAENNAGIKFEEAEFCTMDWTGNPLVDVGIATLCAMNNRVAPRELTLDDLDNAAREMEEYYFSGLLMSYLTCVFMNSEYVQPGSGEKKEQSRQAYAKRVLFAHCSPPDAGVAGLKCAFSGLPATHLIHRGQMPLLTGEDVLNFYPSGLGTLPIAGQYLTALQALPLGGRRCEGKMLIGHSDNGDITIELAKRYLDDNRRLLQLSKAGQLPQKDGADPALLREQGAWDSQKKRAKYPDAKAAPSLISFDLTQVRAVQRETERDKPISVTVYWLSSSGQGPSLALFHLPSNMILFLGKAGMAQTRAQWNRIVSKGWQRPGGDSQAETVDAKARQTSGKRRKVGSKHPTVEGGPGRSRNDVLADLFQIYEGGIINLRAAQTFLRRHLLSELKGAIQSPAECDWNLTELFLKEVLGMEQQRIDAIRTFADRLAEHIKARNNKKLFRDVVRADRAYEFRNALTKAQRNEADSNGRLLFGLDEYLAVFEADDSIGRTDWSLIRDLISIRLVEQLHKSGFLTKEMLQDEEPAQDAA